MTNFEKIKNMSVDEKIKDMSVKEMACEIHRIANYLCLYYDCHKCPLKMLVGSCDVIGITYWLCSEVEK